MSTAFRDIADSNFIVDHVIQNNPLPSDPTTRKINFSDDIYDNDDDDDDEDVDNRKPFSIESAMKGRPEDEWELRHILSSGSLMGKSCQSALILARKSRQLQKQTYYIGKHLFMEPFRMSSIFTNYSFSLVNALVLFH